MAFKINSDNKFEIYGHCSPCGGPTCLQDCMIKIYKSSFQFEIGNDNLSKFEKSMSFFLKSHFQGNQDQTQGPTHVSPK